MGVSSGRAGAEEPNRVYGDGSENGCLHDKRQRGFGQQQLRVSRAQRSRRLG